MYLDNNQGTYRDANIRNYSFVKVAVFPNPALNEISINGIKRSMHLDISICNLSGQVLIKSVSANNIDIAALPAAVYLVKVSADGETWTLPFIKTVASY